MKSESMNGTMKLSKSTCIYVSLFEDDAVLHAASVLADDMRKVFGTAPEIVRDEDGVERADTIRISSRTDVLQEWGIAVGDGAESYHVFVSAGQITLAGADTRGAIYAIYQFSEKVLGVDPMYFWTDNEPSAHEGLELPVGELLQGGTPTFRYRGWFLNDEDLLIGWGRDKSGRTAIDLELWEKIFETILRCRGNMVIPGTYLFSDEPQIRLAGRRGLVISQHHCEVLGLNNFNWPKDVDYSFTQNREVVEAAWQNSAIAYGDQEMIWTVGYRGLMDRAFWADDPEAAPTDEARGAILTEAIERQVEIVKKFREDPYFIWNAWDEGVELFESGHLKLPADVHIVWPDDRSVLLRDGGRVQAGQGAYVHPSFFNDTANHLAEWAPVDRFGRELVRFAEAGATEYLLLNVSNIRPFPMTISAVMAMGWDISSWSGDVQRATGSFYRNWSSLEFGNAASSSLESYYRHYFEAPAAWGCKEGEIFADEGYHTFTASICRRILQGELDAEQGWPLTQLSKATAGEAYEHIAKTTEEALPRWENLWQKAGEIKGRLDEGRRGFFQAKIETQLEVGRQGNLMLHCAANAAVALMKGEGDAVALPMVEEALLAAESFRVALKKAEYGKWKDFYENSWFSNYQHSIALLRALKKRLMGLPTGDIAFVHHRSYDMYEALGYRNKGRQVNTHAIKEYSSGIDNWKRFEL